MESLTLVQYTVLAGVYGLVISTVVLAFAWWLVPHSWVRHPLAFVAVGLLTVVAMTARQTWERRQARRQHSSS
jgi:hypothetical protein